jgi:cation transport regulator ChaC
MVPRMSSGVWVFGYGSLVSPESFGHTLSRVLTRGVDVHPAAVVGFGRRWNYGVMTTIGESDEPDGTRRSWTVVALGITASEHETVNGVVAWVTDDELDALDRRERNYDRVDVSDRITVAVDRSPVDRGPVVTYVPRAEPIEWYEAARDHGTAAVERRYWDLVDAAFTELGPDEHRRYHATTPPPDVPIVAMRRDSVPLRHRVRND